MYMQQHNMFLLFWARNTWIPFC